LGAFLSTANQQSTFRHRQNALKSNCEGTVVSYPLITRLVEVSLNPITATIEVRPREAGLPLEVDWYASMDNLGVPSLEKAAKDFFGKATQTFFPLDRGTFEPFAPDDVPRPEASAGLGSRSLKSRNSGSDLREIPIFKPTAETQGILATVVQASPDRLFTGALVAPVGKRRRAFPF
jgi:hypothetical protein